MPEKDKLWKYLMNPRKSVGKYAKIYEKIKWFGQLSSWKIEEVPL